MASEDHQEEVAQLQHGDEIEIRYRYKVIGFDGPDTLLLNLGDGVVERWDFIFDRDDLDAEVVERV